MDIPRVTIATFNKEKWVPDEPEKVFPADDFVVGVAYKNMILGIKLDKEDMLSLQEQLKEILDTGGPY